MTILIFRSVYPFNCQSLTFFKQDKCVFIIYYLLYVYLTSLSCLIAYNPSLIITQPSWTFPSFLPNAKAHWKESEAAGKPYQMHGAICLYTWHCNTHFHPSSWVSTPPNVFSWLTIVSFQTLSLIRSHHPLGSSLFLSTCSVSIILDDKLFNI